MQEGQGQVQHDDRENSDAISLQGRYELHVIGMKGMVGGHQSQRLELCLRDQYPVEGVMMMGWEGGCVLGMSC